jgi:hypothetical protein
MPNDGALAPEDLALIDRVAARVLELHMEVPALLTLETAAPVSLVAGATMVFFEPFVAALLRLPDYRRFARLIERRDALETLARRIEALAESADTQRRADAAARRKARAPAPPGELTG